MKFSRALLCALLLPLAGQADEWPVTVAEKSDYRQTGDYDQVLAMSRELAERSDRARWIQFGESENGRPLGVLAIGAESAPKAEEAAEHDVVLVTAGIHPGEVAGSDAGLAWVRDLLANPEEMQLGEETMLLFIPVFNVDGHERSGRWHRINQDGPEETGWRSNARNLNLNRDFIKADTAEMEAWLKLFNHWQPDLLLDLHTTNGADFQYDITYILEHDDYLADAAGAWKQESFFEEIFPALEARGHQLAPYIWLRDGEDPKAGFDFFIASPRYSSGYAAVRNRPAMMLEMHALKDYETRVRGSYHFLEETFRHLAEYPGRLREATGKADEEVAEQAKAGESFVLDLTLTGEEEPFELQTYAFSREEIKPIGEFLEYDRDQPKTIEVPYARETEAAAEAEAPRAYAVPPAWDEVIDRLDQHGIPTHELERDIETELVQYRLQDVEWAEQPYEGRQILTDVNPERDRVRRELPAGTRVIPTDNRHARLILHLLEPEAADSLLHWGFFNSIFQNSEYAEPRILARKAAEKLDRDPELARAYQERLEDDPDFADAPMDKVRFLYEQGPWFDRELGILPVYRIESEQELDALQQHLGTAD